MEWDEIQTRLDILATYEQERLRKSKGDKTSGELLLQEIAHIKRILQEYRDEKELFDFVDVFAC